MLVSIGNRTLSVHAARSTPVLCRAPVALRHLSHVSPLQRGLRAKAVILVPKAAAEEAAVTEQTAVDATATAATTINSSTDQEGDHNSKQGRKQQQQRRPRNDSANRNSSRSSSASKASRMQANTLYVQNLAWSTLSEDLQEAFRGCQGFKDAFIMFNKDDRPAGYGFVRFGSEEAAAAAEEAMNGMELDGRSIKVRLARPGRADAPNDSSNDTAESAASGSSSSRVRGASSGDDKFEAATETETRVVVSNLPAGFTYREVFGMCSLFGEVSKVVMSRKNSNKAVPGLDDDHEADEQVEQDAAAVEGDAAAEDEEEQGGSSSAQQQQETRKQGGSALALMVGRGEAESVVAELNDRVVQGSRIRASLYRRRASKKSASAA